MLYHYYMKINFKHIFAAVLAACLFPCAQAQVTVVKQDGNKIYLDTTELNRNVAKGDTFKIIVSREKLTNPKTGKDLGFVYHYSPSGKIVEVQPMYAVGELEKAGVYSAGQEAVLEADGAQAFTPAPVTAINAAPAPAATNRKIKTWPAVEREIVSAVKADLNALPGEEFAALDVKGNLVLYAEEGGALSQKAEQKLPSGKTPLTLSALDVMKTGYAQLFAVVYDEKDQKISTLVFDVSDNEFKQLSALPYFAKELGCGKEKEIYAQKPFVGGAKGGDARELEYKNGKFVTGDDSFSTRGNWLTGLNYYEIQTKDKDNLVYTASNGKLRLRLNNGRFADSPALFASAPNRVKYKQDIITFYPSLQVYGPEGRATLAGVENTTKLGILSQQFGQYNGSKIHFLTYENGILDVRESVSLNGYLYDTNCTSRGILAPQVLTSGQTVLTEIYR